MLDRLRGRLKSTMDSLGRGAASVLPSPTAWTAVGLVFSLFAAAAFWTPAAGGGAVGGLLILVSGFFDIVDGSVARATGKVSKRGGFLDSTLDRVAEFAIFLGILEGGVARADWVLVALSLSLLVSYTRAKADALGTSLSGIGVGERSERLIALAVFSIVGLVAYGVLAVAILAGVTFVQRVASATSKLSKLGAEPSK